VIERRSDSWRARYHGPDGRERNRSFRRKADAERWLAQQRSLIAQDEWIDPARARITFGPYALARRRQLLSSLRGSARLMGLGCPARVLQGAPQGT
jgi:hypothetical protein